MAPRIIDQASVYATTCINDKLTVTVSTDGIHESSSVTIYKEDEYYFLHVRNAAGVPCRVDSFDALPSGSTTPIIKWYGYKDNKQVFMKSSSLGIVAVPILGFTPGTSIASFRSTGSTGGWSNQITVNKLNAARPENRLWFDQVNQINNHFESNHYQTLPPSPLPSTITLSQDSTSKTQKVTFTNKGGIIFTNPAANDSFYRVDVTMEDASQTNLIGFLTLTDKLWSQGTIVDALSIGIDTVGLGTPGRQNTYVYTHLGLKPLSQLTAAQQAFDNKNSNTLVPRKKIVT
jgi:hypothetical protein